VLHLEDNRLLSSRQHGFRKLYSTVTQLIEFTDDIGRCLNAGGLTDCVFLDFAKAFDRVPHDILLQKMLSKGIDISIVHWVKNYLNDRMQYVELDGVRSRTAKVTSGVPQGSVIGPILFLIFINDLIDNLDSSARLFADDCIIYRDIETASDHVLMQYDLDKINSWCLSNRMELNVRKTKLLRFTLRRNVPDYSGYFLNGEMISLCQSYKYLGITFTSDLKFGTHISNIVNKANRVLFGSIKKLRKAPREIKNLAYQTYVRPILEYAAPIWSPYLQRDRYKIESVQRRAARFVLNHYDSQTSVSRLISQQLKWPCLIKRHDIASMKMFCCILFNLVGIDGGGVISDPHYRSARTQHSMKKNPISAKIDVYKNSFYPRMISMWNNLDEKITSADNLDNFIDAFAEWNGDRP